MIFKNSRKVQIQGCCIKSPQDSENILFRDSGSVQLQCDGCFLGDVVGMISYSPSRVEGGFTKSIMLGQGLKGE